jgi:5-carboxymethyl-2-hydroxymuconate isomerase
MPHLRIEYSANLESQVDLRSLCHLAHKAVLATGLFEVGAVRVRAFRTEHYAIADLLPENAFVDMSLRIGAGRNADEKKRAGEAIFAAVSDHLSQLFSTPHFALSFEICEIDADLSWKRNAIHPRLRNSE